MAEKAKVTTEEDLLKELTAIKDKMEKLPRVHEKVFAVFEEERKQHRQSVVSARANDIKPADAKKAKAVDDSKAVLKSDVDRAMSLYANAERTLRETRDAAMTVAEQKHKERCDKAKNVHVEDTAKLFVDYNKALHDQETETAKMMKKLFEQHDAERLALSEQLSVVQNQLDVLRKKHAKPKAKETTAHS